MTTYEEYLQLYRQLPPNLQEIVQQLWANGRSLNARELLRLLYFLFASQNVEQIRRILILLGRLGRFAPGVLSGALELHAGGAGASVVAGEGGAVAAGATAGTALFATIAAVLAAILAIGVAVYTISSEVLTEITFPGTGLKCATGGSASSKEHKITRSGIGSRSAVQKAIDAAQAHCATIGKCRGNCDKGTCKPVASTIRIDPKYRLFWTTVDVYYICVCQCVG